MTLWCFLSTYDTKFFQLYITQVLDIMKTKHEWYSYLIMAFLGFRLILSIGQLTVSILAAVISFIYIALFSVSIYFVYKHEKTGSLLAIFIGVGSIISLLLDIGFINMNIPYNLILIGVSYLEYNRVK